MQRENRDGESIGGMERGNGERERGGRTGRDNRKEQQEGKDETEASCITMY